ncbi:MAG: 2-hydroxychromene-2-carboxylate isomerase [Hellea sp.]|nr:2-hydroxychromene-2-carboxylate isomerase [Hellea sp.]
MLVAHLDLYYDFGSPNAYLAREAFKQLKQRFDLTVKEHPVLIGGIFKATNNQPPWLAHGNCAPKMDYMRLEIMRFVQDHGLTKFKMNSHFPVNTLLAMRAAIAALESGVHEAFISPVFKAMWEDSLDISDSAVLTNILNEAGLDGAGLVAATTRTEIKEKLVAATQAAVDRGIFGLPAFFLEDEMYFGKDRVWMIEKKLSAL